MTVIDDMLKSLTSISGKVVNGFVEDMFPSSPTDPEAPVDQVTNGEEKKDETTSLPSPMQTYTNKVDPKINEPTVTTEAPQTNVTPQIQEEPQQTETNSPVPEETEEPVVDQSQPSEYKKSPVPLHAQKNKDGSVDMIFRGPKATTIKQPNNVALSSKK